MLDSILGGTSSSRLFQAVREQRGLAYAVFSFQSLYRDTGQIGLYGRHSPGEPRRGLRGARRRARSGSARSRWSAEELERAKDNVKGRIVLALESTGARMDRIGSSVLAGMPILELDETLERIEAVDAEEGRRAGRRAARLPNGSAPRRSAPTRKPSSAAIFPLDAGGGSRRSQ